MRILLWDIDGTLIRSTRPGGYKLYTIPVLEEVFGTSGRLADMRVSGMTDLQIVFEALSDAGVLPREIDVLVCASARPESHVKASSIADPSPRDEVMQGFRYRSAWLQDLLDLHNAEVMAVSQQGCATMFSALRVAHALLVTEPRIQHVLCVGVDVLPTGACREILHNIVSDGACAVVVSRGGTIEKWVACRQLSRG